jgi:hypothetical protein
MSKLTKEEYNKLQKDHEEGCKTNDYSKMIMMGDKNDLAMKQYIRDNDLCKHPRIEEIQGGQIERCRDCGKTWG